MRRSGEYSAVEDGVGNIVLFRDNVASSSACLPCK